ncbi:hypothetical protein EV06_0229 [Prochlorococcus sp. MIT 0602]|nr:hypothetical protein EV06_0229 [Prochlorococcus sp. MIT 0602]KGG17133.1 hypothetical protein EV07_0566 [Prochlorococcus sp. MIT 0603]
MISTFKSLLKKYIMQRKITVKTFQLSNLRTKQMQNCLLAQSFVSKNA